MAQIIRLGDRVKDRMTGFEGIVTGTHRFLTGCMKVTVQPEGLKDGKPIDSQWFDIQQVKLLKANAFEVDNGDTAGGPDVMPRRSLL